MERFADDYARRPYAQPLRLVQQFRQTRHALAYADRLGARYVATGHYARVNIGKTAASLSEPARQRPSVRARSARARATRPLLLPLGELDKAATRDHARVSASPVHDKAESQDICFVEGGDYRDVLARWVPRWIAPALVVSARGETSAEHAGIAEYTVGQRSRVPAGTATARATSRASTPSTNTIVVGREDELFSSGLQADELNLIRPERFAAHVRAGAAMVRYRSARPRAEAAVGGGHADDCDSKRPSARSPRASWSRSWIPPATKRWAARRLPDRPRQLRIQDGQDDTATFEAARSSSTCRG